MKVVKRNGTIENVVFDKITRRIQNLIDEESFGRPLSSFIDPTTIAKKVIEGIYDGVSTVDLDILASEISATMAATHPDYSRLAGRICVSNLHKESPSLFSDAIKLLYSYVNPTNTKHSPLVSKDVYDIVINNPEIDGWIDNSRDFEYDYFGYKVLEKSYLLKIGQKIIERPQYMLMRVAIGIHLDNLEKVKETYELMSQKYFTHATPTLFNSGTPQPQMSSCFLLQMNDDSINGIYKTLTDCAKISQHAGGIGLNIHNIRSKGSFIAGTNGTSNGIVPMLRVFNSTARYVDQGGGKRKGSIAIYLEPWHADIMEFLDLKRNTGSEEQRARDLFFGLWIPDLFMRRVENNEDWSLMCPNECEDLSNVYGDEFERKYEQYEQNGKIRKKIKARELYEKIITSQVETGTPYMLYKDHVNRKSNQKNLGTIKSSNLCTEIVEYSSSKETAVCNLASICLPMFVKDGEFDFDKFKEVVKFVTHNLNRVIDRTLYPLRETMVSNLKHRPIGIGVQGLADTFAKLKISFTCEKARNLNKDIFEMLYFASLEASMEEAEVHGPYETFDGSPLSQGLFQFNLWGVELSDPKWSELRAKILTHGVRNSLLIALMPTASTSQIMGNTDSFEPFNSNLYVRRLLSGEFIMFNKYLVEDLLENNLWNNSIKNQLMIDNGSVQNLDIPKDMKEIYKTVWEMKMKDIIDMASDRAIFIDQSQSMNLFVEDPSISKLSSIHMYTWKKGLKTGMYYLRTKSGSAPIKFTADTSTETSKDTKKCDEECLVCSA